MFHPIKTIRFHISAIQASFKCLIVTLTNNTNALQLLTAEQKVLREKFDELVEHYRFQVRVKKSELQRAGHRID